MPPTRNVTAPEISRSRSTDSSMLWEDYSGRGDPDQRYQIRRLCDCPVCDATGKVDEERCPECRGEGRVQELVATAATPEALGVALVQLGRDGEFDDCPLGVLDTMSKPAWIVRPWLPSPRNVSDAGRVLNTAKRRKR